MPRITAALEHDLPVDVRGVFESLYERYGDSGVLHRTPVKGAAAVAGS